MFGVEFKEVYLMLAQFSLVKNGYSVVIEVKGKIASEDVFSVTNKRAVGFENLLPHVFLIVPMTSCSVSVQELGVKARCSNLLADGFVHSPQILLPISDNTFYICLTQFVRTIISVVRVDPVSQILNPGIVSLCKPSVEPFIESFKR